ncbi:hypothetical protein WMF37_45650 [Sorangium sp. So ce291]|uniref:hypothetical protein n=1 Tax=Sorangium sp. So ce291 TaxID=3133294 RepID=UPI003F60BA04
MTRRLRDVLGIGCAAAAALAAGQASAMPPPPGPEAQASPAPRPDAASPAAPPAASTPATPPPPAAPPAGAAAPPAGAWDAPPPGYPPPPPGWTWSPVPWQPEATAGGGEQPATQTVWYGWQHLLVAVGSLILLPVGAGAESEPLVMVGVGGFALGGPVTHWANGNVGKGFISLGLNAGGAFGGGLIGLAIASSGDRDNHGWEELGGFLVGGGLGLLAANIVDIAALEYEERETAESYDYIRVRSPRLRLAPQVGLAPGGATFGLGGAF